MEINKGLFPLKFARCFNYKGIRWGPSILSIHELSSSLFRSVNFNNPWISYINYRNFSTKSHSEKVKGENLTIVNLGQKGYIFNVFLSEFFNRIIGKRMNVNEALNIYANPRWLQGWNL